MNKQKIISSILKEIDKGETEPRASDFDLTVVEFGDLVDMIKEEGLISNVAVARGGQGNKALAVFLNGTKPTMKGLKYLEENSMLAKTYRGLKEVREWIKL